MDDVDRLFECFKCGISPPRKLLKVKLSAMEKFRRQSAMRERKRFKGGSKQESPLNGITSCSTPGSAEQRHRDARDLQHSTERIGSMSIKAKKSAQGIQFSPVVFYGSPNGVPPKRPSSLLRLLQEIHVDLSEQQKLEQRDEIWATFPRQDEAIKFANCHPQVHIFCYQDHFNGQRRFLVCSYKVFWKRYASMDPVLRHHYEVIQEGVPCHLYFDLEYSKKENPEKKGDEMVELLISVVLKVLNDKYSIQGNQEWVIELDSSTEEKFSRHLVIRIPKLAFKDNSHVGAFVTEVCSWISTAKEYDQIYEKLYIKKDSSPSVSTTPIFVDTAVYSRNRCFRLALSSKAGKSAFLLPTKRFKCTGMSEENTFMASLICNMDSDCEKLLVCKAELDCAKTLRFDTEINGNFRNQYRLSQEFDLNVSTSNASVAYLMGKSPFSALDKFIESVASIGTVSGQVRSWYWFSEHGLMVYSMSRNRFFIYVVDLYTAAYYQKCHDPDCRGYRSPLRPVPEDAIPDLSVFFDSRHISNPANSTEDSLPCNESTIESSPLDSWWLEAVRVANDIETQHPIFELGKEAS
ncbi:hypothetical protein CDL15_Pgr023002 [Punica granatum]|uniref:DNA-directed primase/polymerase protein n=1 Tax=Punica granatum TaxID=22663 RepID=A0A218X4L6_PUNGR|nr:hypothetical protein CDL15_Pgr023002 [Punica granatum]